MFIEQCYYTNNFIFINIDVAYCITKYGKAQNGLYIEQRIKDFITILIDIIYKEEELVL